MFNSFALLSSAVVCTSVYVVLTRRICDRISDKIRDKIRDNVRDEIRHNRIRDIIRDKMSFREI